ncbi:MAG: WecB/TagA/CpsF family glycosyltransferase [Verrucomicrobiota bacterium]
MKDKRSPRAIWVFRFASAGQKLKLRVPVEQINQPENPAPHRAAPRFVADQFAILGTPLVVTTYADLSDWCHGRARQPGVVAMEFSNTQIVTLRRHDPAFRTLTTAYDYFIPDSTPLTWCLNFRGARMPDRVYGPTFMHECLCRTTAGFKHYLLGGTEECGRRLRESFHRLNPAANFVGSFHGRCRPDGTLEGDSEQRVVGELNRLSPDFIWVGLGTPRQQGWVNRNKARLARGIICSVGFAFDVNAGMKPDAPAWMQRVGLTWFFRLASEPRRLAGRYLKFNSLFLGYLLADGLRGRAFRPPPKTSPGA